MPSHDEESDEFSDSDPWGSDFETENDMTDAASFRTQDDFLDEEDDPYDSVEISPMRERKRPVNVRHESLVVRYLRSCEIWHKNTLKLGI